VAAAAVELGHNKFNTFSVGFADGGEYSELAYARCVAEHLRSEHHEVVVDQASFLEMLPEAIRSADEPLADLTTVPLLALARSTRERVKVVLSGEGSDEILAGYSLDRSLRYYRAIKQIQTLHPTILKGLGQAVSVASTRYGDALDRLSRVPLSDWNSFHRIHETNFWAQTEKAQLWPTFCGLDSGRVISDMYSAAHSKDPFEQLLSVYQKSWLVEDLLMKADKMSMAASLEVRVPLLDYRLVEWANCQPVGVKVARSRGRRPATKFVLRQFARERLPQAIIDRPKRGFPVPAYGWLQQDKIMRWALAQLTGPKSRLTCVFKPSAVTHQLSLAAKGDLAAAHKTWLLLVLEIWLREYDVEFAVDPHSSLPPLVTSLSAAV
jgi:asparagine synthase (glutamine-hydrolysing)